MIRIAAVGDVHLDASCRGQLRDALVRLPDEADALLLAGDLTRHGTMDEARVVAEEFAGLPVPIMAVLGNHDYHSGSETEIAKLLNECGIDVLEGDSRVVEVRGARLGVAGTIGYGGGFAGRSCGEFGEPETKAFAARTRRLAAGLRESLTEIASCDIRIALTHYSPVPETLTGEPPEIYPFLGSYLLAEAIDAAGATLAVHGHAHSGSPDAMTPGGIPVRNVAQPVIGAAYAAFDLPDPEV